MEILIAQLFSVLAIATNRDGVSPAVPRWLNTLAAILESGSRGRQALLELRDQIETMVLEDRQPTPDEWATLTARSDAAHDIIQGFQARIERLENKLSR